MGYDFAGWVTKNDIQCDDGRVIKAGAFVQSPETVPLYWQHDDSSPENLLGQMHLVHSAEGVYGYGKFNSTPSAQHAKSAVVHRDISALSIRANNLKQRSKEVVGGIIKEVSLVTRGANPGAFIDEIMTHSDDSVSEAIIYTGLEDLIHSSEEGEIHMDLEETTVGDVLDTLNEEQQAAVEIAIELALEDELAHADSEKTVGDVMATLNEEQQAAVEIVLGLALEEKDNDNDNEGDGVDMKHNAFEQSDQTYVGANQHAITKEKFADIIHAASENGTTFKRELNKELTHAGKEYGISNVELLFPDAKNTKGIHILEDKNTNVTKILSSIRKSPFSFVKTVIADLDDGYMRAHGYVTGTKKYDDVFKLLTRKTEPTTVFKRQKLDRDDIIDIQDINVVQLVQGTLRGALEKELVRAILVGDGRQVSDKDKIKEDKIIPISKDADLYTKKYKLESVDKILEAVMYMLTEYQGEGTPSFYCSPTLAVALKLMKTGTGKFLFGEIPTLEAMASRMGVAEVVPTSMLKDTEIIIVNLSDYEIGTNKGGEITNFEDFDIDFNQYKYLIETRLSGALTVPNSAFYITLDKVEVQKPVMLTSVVEGAEGSETFPKPETGK